MTSGGTCTSPRPANHTLDKCVCDISALLGGITGSDVAKSVFPKSAAKVDVQAGCAGCAMMCRTRAQKKHPIGVLEKIRAKA